FADLMSWSTMLFEKPRAIGAISFLKNESDRPTLLWCHCCAKHVSRCGKEPGKALAGEDVRLHRWASRAHRAPGRKGVDGRCPAAVVLNAKSRAKSRQAIYLFFRLVNETFRRRRGRPRERRAHGRSPASPKRVWGDGRTRVWLYFSCAFQSSPAGRSLICSRP